PAHARDRTLAVRSVLEVDREGLAHLGVLDGPAGDVTLGLEDLRDVRLQLRKRHGDVVLLRRVGVSDAGQHVRDRVGHCHWASPPLLTVVSSVHTSGYAVRTFDVDGMLVEKWVWSGVNYQLDLVTPGSSPRWAISRRQIRHRPNLR